MPYALTLLLALFASASFAVSDAELIQAEKEAALKREQQELQSRIKDLEKQKKTSEQVAAQQQEIIELLKKQIEKMEK